MTFRYIDAHCHIQFEQYDDDRQKIIEEMKQEGVGAIVVGCDRESSEKAVVLANSHEHLFASIGLHPNHNDEEVFNDSLYRDLVTASKVVAIGECGLDYFRPSAVTHEVKQKQKMLFQKHIELATAFKKPLIIHARPSKGTQDAYHDVIAMLKDAKRVYPDLTGDIHFFVGTESEARQLIQLGFTVSFTAVITFARDYDRVISSLPLSEILAETDSPYVSPAPRRGERNSPLSVLHVVEKIAEIRGVTPELVRSSVLENTKRLFSLE